MKKAFLPGVTRKDGLPPRGLWSTAGRLPQSSRTPEKKSQEAKQPAKNLGGPVSVIAKTIVIFLLSQFVAAFIAEAGLQAFHPGSRAGLDSSVTAQFVYILIAEALAIGLVFYALRRRGLTGQAIGLGRRPVVSDLWRAAVGFGVFYVLIIIASLIINAVSPSTSNQQQDLGFNNLNNGLENVLAFISLVILPPLGEETLVRGYLYSGLRKVWRFGPAMLVTSLLFGAAHLTGGDSGLLWAAFVDTFLLSVVLVYLRDWTGALYAGMLVHMANNLIAYLIHF